jgi:hypothetical protein
MATEAHVTYRLSGKNWKTAIGLVVALSAEASFARPFVAKYPVVDRLQSGHQALYLYGHQSNDLERQSFKLFDARFMTLDRSVRDWIHERLQNPAIQLRSQSGLGLAAGEDEERMQYEFAVNSVPFCDLKVHAYQIRGYATPVVMGSIPDFDANAVPQLHDWPTQQQALESVRRYMAGIGGDSNVELQSGYRCIALDANEPVPVWKMVVSIDRLPYVVLAGEAVFRMNPHYFDATGTARVFDSNPFDGQLVDYTVGRLIGDGTLTSDVFITEPVGVERVKSDEHRFVFDVRDKGFDETSVFIHATEALEWFNSLGFRYSSKKLFKLKPHAIINGDKNNALYTPETSSSGPTILIGDGDGIWLQNLPKDADVVSHEFGHHVIFQSLKEVRGESLVLHEGLADFFTFARTGNACLGESICPVGSPIPCEVMAQCLRSGETTYRLGDPDLPKEAHRRSQFISGMLWDLRKDGEIPRDDLTAIVFSGVKYLLDGSGYHDFILSLLMADKQLYDGKYSCTIYNAALDRGLSSEISDFSCEGALPSLSAGAGSSSSAGSSSPSVKSTGSSSKSGCATIGNNDLANSQVFGVYLLIFLLPLILVKTQSKLKMQGLRLRHEPKSGARGGSTTKNF